MIVTWLDKATSDGTSTTKEGKVVGFITISDIYDVEVPHAIVIDNTALRCIPLSELTVGGAGELSLEG